MGNDCDFKISPSMLQRFHHDSQSCIDMNTPEVIGRRKAEDPYLSLYGEEKYE